MTVRGLGRLALAAAVLWLATAGVPSPASAARAEALPDAGDLTLGGAAGAVLVGLTVRPAEPGEAAILVHVEPPGGAEAAADLPVDLTIGEQAVAVQRCGPACRRGPATLAGGEEVTVTVGGDRGGTTTFTLPDLPAIDGRALLARATARMNALESYRVEETLGPADPPLRSRYAFAAPDRMRFEVDTGQVTIRVGDRTYTRRRANEPWRTRTGPPLEVPGHIWDYPSPVAVRLIGEEVVDGVGTTVVAFFVGVGDRPIWYRLWVDADGLVRAADMRARGHFMDHRYHAFDEPVSITAPYGLLSRGAVALLGDPPRAYWEGAAAGVRWLVQAGALGAAGGMAFLVFVHDRRRDELNPLARLVAAAALTAAGGTVAGVPLQTAAAAGDAAALVDVEALGEVLVSRSGVAALVRVAGLVVLVAALPRLWTPAAARLAGAAALLVVGSFALTGHTVTADQWPLAVGANVVHLAVAAAWFGGLVLLAWILRNRTHDHDAPAAAALVARFSTLALAGVGLLAVAGLALAWTLVPSLAALPGSVYGRTLLAKLALVAAVVAMAAYNRWRLLPAVSAQSNGALRGLRRTVRAEAAVLLTVLALTALLVNVPPPRPPPAEATPAAAGISSHPASSEAPARISSRPTQAEALATTSSRDSLDQAGDDRSEPGPT